MDAIVDGPHACEFAGIGISPSGSGDRLRQRSLSFGKKVATRRSEGIAEEFKKMVLDSIENRYGAGSKTTSSSAA
ncbi:hypothetical protein [Roseibium aggregatum]|uniref:Uncharacterized protein n=1 Tax=Roseibium aggregatum TaxID=187304 RepID=A0A939J744_9HYPH|nr:hypothetical protein [Roseibium aggregatum]MBN9673439.1 hypothetical protein [Roseibium aggregatum]